MQNISLIKPVSPLQFPLFLTFLTLTHQLILLQRITITQLQTNFSSPFSTSFAASPQLILAFEEIDISSEELAIGFAITTLTTSYVTINIQVLLPAGVVLSDFSLKVAMLVEDEEKIELGTRELNFGESRPTINYFSQKSYSDEDSYRLAIFPLLAPSRIGIESKNSTAFLLNVQILPIALTITSYHVSYMAISLMYITSHIFVSFGGISRETPDYTVLVGENDYIIRSNTTSFLGITGLVSASTTLQASKYVHYDYIDPVTHGNAMKIGYTSSISTLESLTSLLIVFNPDENMGCGIQNNFFAYESLYQSVPIACVDCYWTCQTCIGSFMDPVFTNENFCTSCPTGRYFKPSSGMDFGQCLCLPSLSVDQFGNCIPCNFDCLVFTVTFLRSEVLPKFLLLFSHSPIEQDIDISKNLQIFVNQNQLSYKINQHQNSASYIIQLDPNDLTECESACEIKFFFLFPQKIHTPSGKYLSHQDQTLEVFNYFSIQNRLPEGLKQAFFVAAAIIGAASASGQTSMIRMLFELEQIIQFHKYINLQLPMVFKEFVEALSAFKFMDLTFFIPEAFFKEIKHISPDELDSKGPTKAIYYETGANFFKNFIPILFSFIVILLINLMIFFIFKFMPCQILRNLSKKMQTRASITISDMTESMVLPAVIFSIFQASYMMHDLAFSWIYFFQKTVILFIILCPFLILIVKMKKWRSVEGKQRDVEKEVLEDLFQDCKIESKMAPILYISNYYRKFLFAIFLHPILPGILQIILLMLVNFYQFFIILYMVLYSLNTSKIKVITRSINIICVITIEFMILIYNIEDLSEQKMILVGVTCTYMTIVATITGICEVFIKLLEIIKQRITSGNEITNEHVFQNTYIDDENKVKCYLGKGLKDRNRERERNRKGKTGDSNFHKLPESSPENSEISSQSEEFKQSKNLRKRNERKKDSMQDRPWNDGQSDDSQIIPLNSDDYLANQMGQTKKLESRDIVVPSSAGNTSFQPSAKQQKRNRFEIDSNFSDTANSNNYYKRAKKNPRKERTIKHLNSLRAEIAKKDPRQIYERKKKKKEEESEMSEIVNIEDD